MQKQFRHSRQKLRKKAARCTVLNAMVGSKGRVSSAMTQVPCRLAAAAPALQAPPRAAILVPTNWHPWLVPHSSIHSYAPADVIQPWSTSVSSVTYFSVFKTVIFTYLGS